MVMNFIVYLSLIHFVNDQDKYDKLLKTWLGIHVFLAIIGIVKHGRGIGGFLGDENDFCLALNMIIPFPFFLAVSTIGEKTNLLRRSHLSVSIRHHAHRIKGGIRRVVHGVRILLV